MEAKVMRWSVLVCLVLAGCTVREQESLPDECGDGQICAELGDADAEIVAPFANVYFMRRLTADRVVMLDVETLPADGTIVRVQKVDEDWKLRVQDETAEPADFCAIADGDIGWCEMQLDTGRWLQHGSQAETVEE